jgi:hypothetical protein
LRIAPTLPPPPPKFSGSALMRSPLTLMPCSALAVLRSGASPVTLTTSAAAPISSIASTRVVCATCTRTPADTNVLKPGASIDRS